MRGKGYRQKISIITIRITPAYAGKRNMLLKLAEVFEDHPCVCGEKSPLFLIAAQGLGSPLRMRGKGFIAHSDFQPFRITPAYAGKSTQGNKRHKWRMDHPCVCGEKLDKKVVFQGGKGSPLRMRGKARKYHRVYIFRRITPAYAGKSLAYAEGDYLDQDHPCVCGEKTVIS